MHKHMRRGRASFAGFSYDHFLHHCLLDLKGGIGDELTGTLLASLSDPVLFREAVSQALHKAESSLSDGGALKYMALRQVEALLKKNPDWHALSPADRKSAALSKFDSSESACRRANKRLSWFREHWSRGSYLDEVLNQASLHAFRLVGVLDQERLEQVFDACSFGNGASFFHRRGKSSVYDKLSSNHTVTEGALPLLASYMATSPALYEGLRDKPLEVVRGNRIDVVPKNWDIDRVIAIEPSWNVFLQLGFDKTLKGLLRRSGVYLRDQERNYPLCREGSISGDFATIDLSSASDRISVEVVRRILPKSWFSALEAIRSPEYTTDKGQTWHEYAKFSSMGNGFTFPLESLVFYTLCRACYDYCGLDSDEIRVYGDDLIVRRECYALLSELLAYCGFEVNGSKSYCFGPFRESCGRDYLQGLNVRPVYVRRTPRNVEDIYNVHNRLLVGSMFPLPRALAYLRSCVVRPHWGPWYSGNSSVSIDKILAKEPTWVQAGSVRFDQYFMTDEPTVPPVWNPDLQCFEWRLRILDKRYKTRDDCTDAWALYRTFLYGIPPDGMRDHSRIRYFDRTVAFTSFPRLSGVGGWQAGVRAT